MSSYKAIKNAPTTNETAALTFDDSTPSSTWLNCDGSIVSQATYPNLYAKLGTLPNGVDGLNAAITGGLNDIRYLNSRFVFFIGNSPYTSISGFDAVSAGTTSLGSVRGIAYGNSTYCAMDNSNSATSTNLSGAWTTVTSVFSTTQRSLAYGNSLFVTVGDSGTYATSTNGTTWTNGTMSSIFNSWFGLAYGDHYGTNKFVAVGDGGMATSTNGTTWDIVVGAVSSNRVVYTNNKFLGFTNSTGTQIYEYGSSTWSLVGTTTVPIFGLTYLGTNYFLNSENDLYYSSDLTTWTLISSNLGSAAVTSGLAIASGGSSIMFGADNSTAPVSGGTIYNYNPSTEFALPESQQILSDSTSNMYIKGV